MAKTTNAGTLLLCVDVQPVFLAMLPNREELVQRCSFAIEAASGLGLPVAFTEQVPQKLGATANELTSLVPEPKVWGKTTFSALADDGIREALRQLDIDHLLICGLETPVCVYQTALDALDAQYQVTVLSDAVGARRDEDAATVLSSLRHAGVRTLPVESVFYSLLHDAKHPFFKTYTQLVKKYG